MRSLLFTPADSDRKLQKGLTSGADVLLVDLEDAIAPDNKPAAREKAAAFLKSSERAASKQPVYVRINDLETGLADADLDAVIGGAPDGIMLPKARSADDITALEAMLDQREAREDLEPGKISILVLAFETPVSLLNMASFQTCGPRVTGYTWGAEDMAAIIGAKANRDDTGDYAAPFALARNVCLYAAASAGVNAIDTVYVDFRDLEGLERDAREAARDGFTGKAAIHPDQVAVINKVFTPSAEEVAHAEKIIAAFDAAPGAGTVGLDGKMVDRPHLVIAELTLERARSAGVI